MCIMSYLPPGIPVDKDGLYNGGMNNPDGHGWAVVTQGRILVGKSMDLTDALDAFVAARLEHPDGPALFHSRWATHGKLRVDNVHPFKVAKSPQTVVAHNGILRESARPGKGDHRSDTRIFADEILHKQFRRLDRPGTRKALTQWCGPGNKLVILTIDPRYEHNAYLINEEAGQWDKPTGIWHSNGDYKWYTASKYRWAAAYDWESWPTKIGKSGGARSSADVLPVRLEDKDCLYCGSPAAVDECDFCTFCHSCQDCGSHVNDCMCWREDAHDLAEVAIWEEEEAERERVNKWISERLEEEAK